MEAIQSLVTFVLSMLMAEMIQLELQYYELKINILYLTNLFKVYGKIIENAILDINHKDNIAYIIMQYPQILCILKRFMLELTNRWYIMP